MSTHPTEATGRRVGTIVGATLAALPCGFFVYIGFAFSMTGPPGSGYPWGEMLSMIVFFLLEPVAVAGGLGRLVGGLIGKLLATRH